MFQVVMEMDLSLFFICYIESGNHRNSEDSDESINKRDLINGDYLPEYLPREFIHFIIYPI